MVFARNQILQINVWHVDMIMIVELVDHVQQLLMYIVLQRQVNVSILMIMSVPNAGKMMTVMLEVVHPFM